MSDQPTEYRLRCVNLCGKSMLIHGEEAADDPEHQSGAGGFWCLCTSKPYGPDGGDATPEECANSGRSCYQQY
jgi:hypothetical protein